MSNRAQQLNRPKGKPLPDGLIEGLRALVKKLGRTEVTALVGCQPETFASALAGLPVYPGTVALVREAVRKAGGGA